MKKTTRAALAKETLEIMKNGYYKTESGKRIDIATQQRFAEANTVLYNPENSEKLSAIIYTPQYSTTFEVRKETSLDAVLRLIEEGYEDVMCLNFASAKNPGGGFLNGAVAQEESLAMVTGLYNCQLKAWDYYENHRALTTCLYTDTMIYAPKVPIFKTDSGKPLDKLKEVSFITSPAVNTGVVKRQEPHNIAQIEPYMRRRIAKVLTIAAHHKHKALVLGAWGCGVFQNDPNDVARWFKEVLDKEFKGVFSKIVFAVYSRDTRFIEPFEQYFT